jgi:hypothetical protein
MIADLPDFVIRPRSRSRRAAAEKLTDDDRAQRRGAETPTTRVCLAGQPRVWRDSPTVWFTVQRSPGAFSHFALH